MPSKDGMPSGTGPTKSTNGAFSFDQDVQEQPKGSTTGYPHGKPKHVSDVMYWEGEKEEEGIGISIPGHFKHHIPPTDDIDADPPGTFLFEIPQHYTRDLNAQYVNEYDRDPNAQTQKTFTRGSNDGPGLMERVFSGATTNINPLNDGNVADIAAHGLHSHETTLNGGKEPSISPMLPFTRVNPNIARISNIFTYNRTKLPVADLEWRKGFRHIFITRPECYVMGFGSKGQPVLSEQCENDEDFRSSYYRMPEVCYLLSPFYVTGDNDNFNYLLSNRVMGLQTTGTSLSYDEGVQKSIEGYTVSPAKIMTSNQGSSISLSFKETKYLEVYEYLRMWMMYCYKTYKGILMPSYNGYKAGNSLNLNNGAIIENKMSSMYQYMMHPYDRALDYCASLFDIVTNESMTKILYWCKYYGIYPVNAAPSGLSNNNNNAVGLNDFTTTAEFRYQRKMEMRDSTLIEFNMNAGVVDYNGRNSKSYKASQSFMYNEDYDHNDVNYQNKTYMGAAGMFTGSPFIVMENDVDPVTKTQIFSPYLKFQPIERTLFADGAEGNRKHFLDLNVMNNYIVQESDNAMTPAHYVDSTT
jgi:hypothetical protein